MRVLLIDYSGTLTRLDNPVAFVEKLRAQGDYCILMSGHDWGHIEQRHPGLPGVFHEYKSRISLAEIVADITDTSEWYDRIGGPLSGITEVVVVDDNGWNVQGADDYSLVTEKRHGFPCRGLDAEEIKTLLRSDT